LDGGSAHCKPSNYAGQHSTKKHRHISMQSTLDFKFYNYKLQVSVSSWSSTTRNM